MRRVAVLGMRVCLSRRRAHSHHHQQTRPPKNQQRNTHNNHQDGTANWLKGAMLVFTYFFIAAGFWVHKDPDLNADEL